ncbi:DNA polymerase III subunit beta [Moorellaceae bacterium AZ2]
MRCQIGVKELAGLLDAARPFLAKTTTMTVLECFHLEARGDRLHCSATDLQMGITVSASAEVPPGAEGTVLVPGKLFCELVDSFPSCAQVELEASGNTCTVLCGKSRAELTVIDPQHYPTPPEQEKDALRFAVPADAFKETIKEVLVAAGDGTYNSVLFDFDGERLHLVATDTHRLALYEGLVEVRCEPRKVLLPADSMRALSKVLPEGQGVEVLIGPTLAYFTCGNAQVFTRLLNWNFPPYRQVLPTEARAGLVVDRRILLDALERVALLVDTSQRVRYCLLSLNSSVTLEAFSDTGMLHEVLPAEAEGEIRIAFNPSYLAKILRVALGERVKLEFTGALRPITVNSEKCLYILLPVRVPELLEEGGGA